MDLAVGAEGYTIMFVVNSFTGHYCFWTILGRYSPFSRKVVKELHDKKTIYVVICIGIDVKGKEWRTALMRSLITRIRWSRYGSCLLAAVRLRRGAPGSSNRNSSKGAKSPSAMIVIIWKPRSR